MNKTAKTAARKTVNVLMLVILAFLTTLPIFWCIITSLKTPQDISAYPPKIFNFTVTWNNYKQVFAQSFLQTAGNSVVYSLLTILACLVLGYLAAYGFERRRFPLKKLLFYIVVIGIPLSTGSSVLLIPNYLMMMKLHLTNHWYTLPLLYTAYNLPLVIWMLISGVRGLPYEIEEAARIDGCSQFYIITRHHPAGHPSVVCCGCAVRLHRRVERVHHGHRHGQRLCPEKHSDGDLRLHRLLRAGVGSALRRGNACHHPDPPRVHLPWQTARQRPDRGSSQGLNRRSATSGCANSRCSSTFLFLCEVYL